MAMPLRPASAVATGEPATAPKSDPMLPASPSPCVAAAAAAAPTAAASSSSSDQPQAATSKQKAVRTNVQQLQASTSGSGATKKQHNGVDEDEDFQKVLQSKVSDQSSTADTPSSNSRAAASSSTAAASADAEGAPLSSRNLTGDTSLSTERSGWLPSVAHQQADLHANVSATTAAPQGNGHAPEQQQPQQQLQQQQQASKAAQEAVSVTQNVATGGRDRAPAKAHAGNTTGMALAAPRSGDSLI